jgi:perosamine synthetase
MCSHREEPYRDRQPPWPLAQSEAAQDHCILLPLFAQMTLDEQQHVASSLAKALGAR